MDGKILSMDEIFMCQSHPLMEKMMDDFFICGCHPWMKSIDEDDA